MDWLEGATGLAVYLVLKLGGYLACTWAGIRWLGHTGKPARAATLLGVARLVIGWATGIAVAPFAIVAVSTDRVPIFYFTVLAVVRWFEWGVIQVLIPGARDRDFRTLVSGGSGAGRAWRVLGIAASYLADAPFLLTSGFPHGRLFC